MWKARWNVILNRVRIVHSAADQRALLASLTAGPGPRILGFVNAHAMNYCAADDGFFDALSGADILLRDGAGMEMLYRRARREPGINMNGTDFIPRILEAFRGRSVAFWGTTEPFLQQAALRGASEFGVSIASCEHGFASFEHYFGLIDDMAPDLIVLSMGMPKQEQLALELRERAHGTTLIVCGGAILDFLGGRVARAPPFLRNAGLEWLYRFLREPRRLFKRYVLGNPKFLVRLISWTRNNAA